jgi:hypothetical protein
VSNIIIIIIITIIIIIIMIDAQVKQALTRQYATVTPL